MQQNPTLREEFELLGLDFSDEVRVSDRSHLIEQISASVRRCQLVLLVDHAPQLRAREILAQGFNKPLHQNERAAADIRKYLGNQGRMPNDRLLQGAMMPQDALPLSDPGCGQAGFVLFFPTPVLRWSAARHRRCCARWQTDCLALCSAIFIRERSPRIFPSARTSGRRWRITSSVPAAGSRIFCLSWAARRTIRCCG